MNVTLNVFGRWWRAAVGHQPLVWLSQLSPPLPPKPPVLILAPLRQHDTASPRSNLLGLVGWRDRTTAVASGFPLRRTTTDTWQRRRSQMLAMKPSCWTWGWCAVLTAPCGFIQRISLPTLQRVTATTKRARHQKWCQWAPLLKCHGSVESPC